ncbi:MAG: PucR family transcriptional regulator ligand-binding domain-containing protein [Clostridiaceae bacterium]|nr:PucR family transcriptional regulator ligand-binding domain-containing protein [Clostridiaceae bacterium]
MTVEDILRLDEQIAVLSGENGLHHRVSYIDVVEVPEGMHWTSPDDFILTTGYCFAGNDALLELLVRTLIQKDVAGLGIKTGKYVHTIPSRILKLAEEHAFPILRIPMHFSYREISWPLLKALASNGGPKYRLDSLSNFYEALIRGDLRTESEIRTNAVKYGVSFSGLRYVIVVHSKSALPRDSLTELSGKLDLMSDVQSCCLEADRQNIMQIICRIQNPESFLLDRAASAKRIFETIHSMPATSDALLAMSAPCQTLLDIYSAAIHTRALLNLGLRLHPNQKSFFFDDYYLDLLLNDNQSHYGLIYLYQTYIEPLINADAHQGTELLPTLLMLCEHSFGIAETGQALYVHRNTVYNRIKHMEGILGCCIGDLKTQNALILACKYYLLRQAEDR